MVSMRWPRWSSTTVTVIVLCGIAAAVGAYSSVRGWRYAPAAPPDSCVLVRPAVLDVLTPGHDYGPELHSTFWFGHEDPAHYSRVSSCVFAGPRADLTVTVWHVGYGPAGGPAAQAHALYETMYPELGPSRYGPTVPGDLGDESAHQPDGEAGAFYSARMGAYVVQIVYEAHEAIGYPAARDAAHAALQEVLSRL
jgi:hypothetical protein